MYDTLTRYLEGVSDQRTVRALRPVLEAIADRMSSQPLNSAGLIITGSGGTAAKTGSAAFYATAQGDLVSIAASTTMPALTGINIPAGGHYNVAAFFIDSSGTVTVAGGTPGISLSTVVFPQFPKGKALVGFLIITYASAFTGGTTALDTATTVYVSPIGPFDPSILI